MEQLPAAVKRSLRYLAITGLLLQVPVVVHADASFKEWLYRILHWNTPSADESALAPEVAPELPVSSLLRDLRSHSPQRTLQALDNIITHMQPPDPRLIASLIRTTQDTHPKIAQRATQALSNLCLQGHTPEVIQAFSQTLRDKNLEIRILQPEFSFKVLNPAEEARAEARFDRKN